MNKKIAVLLFSIFLDILSFSFILPIIPFIVKGFSGNSFSVWLIVAGAALWMFIWGIIFWKLSDVIHRKKVLLFTVLLNISGYLLFALSFNIWIFFIARFLCWLGWGGMSVVQAYISDLSWPKEKIINMWYIWASVWLWFTIWPIFGSLMSDMELKNMWFISALILIISFIFIYLFLPNEKTIIQHENTLDLKHTPKKLLTLFLTYSLVTVCFAGIQTIFALYLSDIFWFTSRNVWYVFWFIWISAIIFQVFWIKYMSKLLWEVSMIKIWLILFGLWLALIGFNENMVILFLILILIAIWISSVNTAIFTLITKYSSSDNIWKNLWINTAFWSVGDIIWPIISWGLFLLSIRAPFYFFAWVILFNLLIFTFLKID